MTAPLVFVVPGMIDDPERVSGGNVYDRQLCAELVAAGHSVRIMHVRGDPEDAAAPAAVEPPGFEIPDLADVLDGVPDQRVALIDGLLVSREPEAVLAHRDRLVLAVLAHMAPADPQAAEVEALRAATLIIATSEWTRAALAARGVDPARIAVARPGVDPAPRSLITPDPKPTPDPAFGPAPRLGPAQLATRPGGRLLCVAAVAPHKGQDLLVTALAAVADLDGWNCVMVGSCTAEPEFVTCLEHEIKRAGIGRRVTFAGVLAPEQLPTVYAQSDLLIHPSRGESYGMVIAEALTHGTPVLATHVGGVAEAVTRRNAVRFVPPEDAGALGRELRSWLTDPERRAVMTRAAGEAGAAGKAQNGGRTWAETAAIIAGALARATVTSRFAGAR